MSKTFIAFIEELQGCLALDCPEHYAVEFTAAESRGDLTPEESSVLFFILDILNEAYEHGKLDALTNYIKTKGEPTSWKKERKS